MGFEFFEVCVFIIKHLNNLTYDIGQKGLGGSGII